MHERGRVLGDGPLDVGGGRVVERERRPVADRRARRPRRRGRGARARRRYRTCAAGAGSLRRSAAGPDPRPRVASRRTVAPACSERLIQPSASGIATAEATTRGANCSAMRDEPAEVGGHELDARAAVDEDPLGRPEETADVAHARLGEERVEVEQQRAEHVEVFPVVAFTERVQQRRRADPAPAASRRCHGAGTVRWLPPACTPSRPLTIRRSPARDGLRLVARGPAAFPKRRTSGTGEALPTRTGSCTMSSESTLGPKPVLGFLMVHMALRADVAALVDEVETAARPHLERRAALLERGRLRPPHRRGPRPVPGPGRARRRLRSGVDGARRAARGARRLARRAADGGRVPTGVASPPSRGSTRRAGDAHRAPRDRGARGPADVAEQLLRRRPRGVQSPVAARDPGARRLGHGAVAAGPRAGDGQGRRLA